MRIRIRAAAATAPGIPSDTLLPEPSSWSTPWPTRWFSLPSRFVPTLRSSTRTQGRPPRLACRSTASCTYMRMHVLASCFTCFSPYTRVPCAYPFILAHEHCRARFINFDTKSRQTTCQTFVVNAGPSGVARQAYSVASPVFFLPFSVLVVQ